MAFFNGLTLVEPDALHARVGKFAQDVEGSAPRDAQDVGSRFPSLSQAGFKKFTSDNYKYAPPVYMRGLWREPALKFHRQREMIRLVKDEPPLPTSNFNRPSIFF